MIQCQTFLWCFCCCTILFTEKKGINRECAT